MYISHKDIKCNVVYMMYVCVWDIGGMYVRMCVYYVALLLKCKRNINPGPLSTHQQQT